MSVYFKRGLVLLFMLSFWVWTPSVFAESNNIFGIHITDINEAQKASELVNSSGGDWGYVTMTINSNDRVIGKWQDRMNTLNRLHLIPIVRLTTYGNGGNWVKPGDGDAHDWAVFLRKLYWPTQKKIVVVYNEPNHGSEWAGETNPAEYAKALKATIDELHKSKDFVVLNAGFDSSTPQQPPLYMDQIAYMDAMNNTVPGIFEMLDGWSSHSYPNPGFAGKPTDTGRGTIRNYEWELDLLKNRYKVQKDLPVYITETGWAYKNGDHTSIRITEQTAADFTTSAFKDVWLADKRVVSVTPFLLSYKLPLFSQFSWLWPDDTNTLLYEGVKSLPKTAGAPPREDKSALVNVSVPSQIPQGAEIIGSLAYKNTGNSIWTLQDGIHLQTVDQIGLITRQNFTLPETAQVYPGQSYVFRFTLFTENINPNAQLGFQLQKNESYFGEKLFIPMKIFIKPKMSISITKQDNTPIQTIQILFHKGKQTDNVTVTTVPANGFLGTFTSNIFGPGEEIEVEARAPNRPVAKQKIKVVEGENAVAIPLEPEIPFWKRLFNLQ